MGNACVISQLMTAFRLHRRGVVSIREATGAVPAHQERESIAKDTNFPNKHTKTISSEERREEEVLLEEGRNQQPNVRK